MSPDAELPFDRVCRVGVVDIKRKRVLGAGRATHLGVAEELDMAATWLCAGQGGWNRRAGRARGPRPARRPTGMELHARQGGKGRKPG